MATITLTVEGSTIGTVRVTETLEGVSSDMVLGCLVATYGRDEMNNHRGPAQIVAAYWATIQARLLADARRYHQDLAAADAPTEIAALIARDAVPEVVGTTVVG